MSIEKGKILSIDYGSKNIGFSISDNQRKIAFPLYTLKCESFSQALVEIKKIIEKENIKTILTGIAWAKSNMITKQTRKTLEFKEFLQKKLPIEVISINERFSTKIMENFLINQGDLSRNKRKKVIDKLAATYLLQEFLKFTNNQKIIDNN